MKNQYRKLAEDFAVDGSASLKDLFSNLRHQLQVLDDDDKAAKVEGVLVEWLENALRDEFGLAIEIEGVLTEEDSE